MAKNGIKDLRNLMMETIERLMDDDDPMDAPRANAIAAVGNVVVGSAKVQLQIAKFSGRQIPDEFQSKAEPKQLTAFAKANKCVDHATSFGHTSEEAENCENYSVGCPNCPFK